MVHRGFLKKHGIVRNAIKKDLIQFAIPGLIIFGIEIYFCARDGLTGFWGSVWELIKQPQDLLSLPLNRIVGLALFFVGLMIMLIGQITLWRNYSGTVVIRKNHQLITHGIYRLTRNPIYLGLIMVIIGLPVYAGSFYGFISALVLVPIILNRIRLEEILLTEEFQDTYLAYKKNAKRLIPFIY